ncbi:hypothetical protein BDZ94DRAFT_1179628 [Collybia nuda]|uniref:Uncharacterized protein n=1 Tax=Collybia nuda TaxID=64659 RepID=A0A9P5XS92_9AGAR|nr:hypothetical protein BDZ94DRAFT_1179628 [Collybia nuda]
MLEPLPIINVTKNTTNDPPSSINPKPQTSNRTRKRELLPLTPHRSGAPIKRHASNPTVPSQSEDPFKSQPHVFPTHNFVLNPIPLLTNSQGAPRQNSKPTYKETYSLYPRMDERMQDPPSPSPPTPIQPNETHRTILPTQEPQPTAPPQTYTLATNDTINDPSATLPPTTSLSKRDLSDLDALVANNGVITHSNGLRRTAIPTNGFPIPQLGESVWRNIPPSMKTRWAAKPGPKAWARLYRAFYTEDMSSQAQEITELIKRFTDAPSVLVSTPIAESRPNPSNGPPHHFLISGLSQQAHDRIVNTGVIATETTIILTLPFIQPPPEYLGTLENFSLGDTDNDKRTVAEAVKSALTTNPGISTFVNDHTSRTNPETFPLACNSIRIETLRIRTSKTTNKIVWNVYCDNPPPLPFDKYIQWVKIIKNLNFPTEDFGAGRMRNTDHRGIERQFHCAGCKSCDHPTGLCPLPDILGWLGPAHATEDFSLLDNHPTNPENIRGRGRGQTRGGRSRGRGPRNRGRF